MTRNETLTIAIFTASIFALSLTSTTPSQAKEMTPCEKMHFKFYYEGPPQLDATEAYKKAKKICKTVKAKEKKKKNTNTATFGANTIKRGFVIR